MKRIVTIAALIGVASLSGCATVDTAAFDRAEKACANQKWTDWAQCTNDAQTRYYGSGDLLSVLAAKRMEVAEKVDGWSMTPAEARLQLATLTANLNSTAQQRAAAAAAAVPTSCTSTPIGSSVTTTCY